MKRTLMMTAAFLFAGQMAFAALSTDTVVSDLTGLGYTRIEIKTSPTQMKVEAIRGTEKLEIIYDIETGAVLKQEMGKVYQGENTTPGVEIATDDDDFVDGNDDGNDDAEDANDNDDDNDNDDAADANDDNDDNSGDDNDDQGSDDDGDDSGSDDDGDDDGGDDDGDDSGDRGGDSDGDTSGDD